MLEVNNLSKSFGDVLVLDNINFVIKKGDIVSIVGPSGSGKSTLLRCLNYLEKPSKGDVIFEGNKVNKIVGKGIGMVFQQFNLFPNMTVLDNIILSPVKLKIMSYKDALKKACELLEIIGLSDKKDNYPNELSGGQKQRLAIARTLMLNTKIILFDEATSALDNESQEYIKKTIDALVKNHTIIIVAHRLSTIVDADIINVIDKGTLESYGTHTELLKKSKIYQNLYSNEFSNSQNTTI